MHNYQCEEKRIEDPVKYLMLELFCENSLRNSSLAITDV